MCHSCTPLELPQVEPLVTRSVFRRAAYPTWVITGVGAQGPVATTVTSVVPVSMDPPLVSFNLSKGSPSVAVLKQTRWVAAHLLDESQRAIAIAFSRDNAAPLVDDGTWRFDQRGLPELRDTCARLVLSVRELVDAGDSYVVLADVDAGAVLTAAPLMHHRGHYSAANRTAASTAA